VIAVLEGKAWNVARPTLFVKKEQTASDVELGERLIVIWWRADDLILQNSSSYSVSRVQELENIRKLLDQCRR